MFVLARPYSRSLFAQAKFIGATGNRRIHDIQISPDIKVRQLS
ncbi:hypothetical protein HMPREF9622_00820 [Cutibacterium modestum HL037PA3]|uniref:Uncharacterized protein n=1 Tax=Cutibacterium modestum HL044PA1 TaxID=765109 RepID=A0ABN0C3C8_9ACTN|nr:hypothetical protein HMPREF9621_00433 [Cutibacterium modestum HL037PA2]EFS91711.1 hypothetical protein HMPREF9607_02221 [Cutibacterium modestum HL044PA1]EFT15963.1 hypothetical protein HMPREF9622_00820 [Cutibacterium modestum HL037PA3]EGG27105.1 hypothetical protein PA08_1347 [Cutibacterium modestum P08]